MNSRYSRWWFEPSFLGSCGSNNAIFTTHDWEWLIAMLANVHISIQPRSCWWIWWIFGPWGIGISAEVGH